MVIETQSAYATDSGAEGQIKPLDNKEIKPVNLKGNQLCIFIGGTEAEQHYKQVILNRKVFKSSLKDVELSWTFKEM